MFMFCIVSFFATKLKGCFLNHFKLNCNRYAKVLSLGGTDAVRSFGEIVFTDNTFLRLEHGLDHRNCPCRFFRGLQSQRCDDCNGSGQGPAPPGEAAFVQVGETSSFVQVDDDGAQERPQLSRRCRSCQGIGLKPSADDKSMFEKRVDEARGIWQRFLDNVNIPGAAELRQRFVAAVDGANRVLPQEPVGEVAVHAARGLAAMMQDRIRNIADGDQEGRLADVVRGGAAVARRVHNFAGEVTQRAQRQAEAFGNDNPRIAEAFAAARRRVEEGQARAVAHHNIVGGGLLATTGAGVRLAGGLLAMTGVVDIGAAVPTVGQFLLTSGIQILIASFVGLMATAITKLPERIRGNRAIMGLVVPLLVPVIQWVISVAWCQQPIEVLSICFYMPGWLLLQRLLQGNEDFGHVLEDLKSLAQDFYSFVHQMYQNRIANGNRRNNFILQLAGWFGEQINRPGLGDYVDEHPRSSTAYTLGGVAATPVIGYFMLYFMYQAILMTWPLVRRAVVYVRSGIPEAASFASFLGPFSTPTYNVAQCVFNEVRNGSFEFKLSGVCHQDETCDTFANPVRAMYNCGQMAINGIEGSRVPEPDTDTMVQLTAALAAQSGSLSTWFMPIVGTMFILVMVVMFFYARPMMEAIQSILPSTNRFTEGFRSLVNRGRQQPADGDERVEPGEGNARPGEPGEGNDGPGEPGVNLGGVDPRAAS